MGRILVVDDDPESRALLSEVLEANGFPQVEAVADGLAAREALARDGDCPIIIADLHMPNESGLDLLRNLRKQNAKHEIDGEPSDAQEDCLKRVEAHEVVALVGFRDKKENPGDKTRQVTQASRDI